MSEQSEFIADIAPGVRAYLSVSGPLDPEQVALLRRFVDLWLRSVEHAARPTQPDEEAEDERTTL